jgi:hypothetical protein
LSCLVLSCPVLSCLVLSCPVLSNLIWSYLVRSCTFWSCLVRTCLVSSCLIVSGLVWSFLIWSCLASSHLKSPITLKDASEENLERKTICKLSQNWQDTSPKSWKCSSSSVQSHIIVPQTQTLDEIKFSTHRHWTTLKVS